MRRVVVTGAGVVSPIGCGLKRFGQGLRLAQPGIGYIQSFDASTFPTRIAGQVTDLQAEALLAEHPQGPALGRDPKSLFGLLAAREALSVAFPDHPPGQHHDPRRIACVIASGLEIFHLDDVVGQVHNDRIQAPALMAEVMARPCGTRLQFPAHLGARCIADEVRAEGPFAVNVSACAAGTQALGEASLLIRDGVADLVVSGGYDSMVNPLGVGGFCMLEALSRSNELGPRASRPFDARRDGFVLGEGAGVIVLEEYDAARARGASILAEVLGYASTMDAFRVSDPAEDHAMAAASMSRALADAKLNPGAIDYISAHGTGTRKNDPAETRAVKRVFGPAAAGIPMSSTKSQIGHLIGAAGAVEFIAGLFALEHDLLPATINLEEPDPECDLDYVPGQPRPARIHTFLSNSFGFGGQNATIIAGRLRP